MPRHRMPLVAGTLALLALAGLVCVWLTRHRQRITREGYQDIQFGMTLQQVKDVLGAAPGCHQPQGYFARFEEPETLAPRSVEDAVRIAFAPSRQEWAGREGIILVDFDEAGLVVRKQFAPVVPLEEEGALWDRLCRLLDW